MTAWYFRDCWQERIINANATVDHDVVMEELSHIGVGVQLAGSVKIGVRAWLQAGAVVGMGLWWRKD